MDVHTEVGDDDEVESHRKVEVKGTAKGQDPVGMEQEDELDIAEVEDETIEVRKEDDSIGAKQEDEQDVADEVELNVDVRAGHDADVEVEQATASATEMEQDSIAVDV